MTPQRPPGRSAWIVKLDVSNPAAHRDVLDRIGDPSQPLAVFPWNTSSGQMLAVVDAFVQAYLWTTADDRLRFTKRPTKRDPESAYGRASVTGLGGEISGGFNPYIEAFVVRDLQLVTDDETGATRFTWTRRPAR